MCPSDKNCRTFTALSQKIIAGHQKLQNLKNVTTSVEKGRKTEHALKLPPCLRLASSILTARHIVQFHVCKFIWNTALYSDRSPSNSEGHVGRDRALRCVRMGERTWFRWFAFSSYTLHGMLCEWHCTWVLPLLSKLLTEGFHRQWTSWAFHRHSL